MKLTRREFARATAIAPLAAIPLAQGTGVAAAAVAGSAVPARTTGSAGAAKATRSKGVRAI